MRFPQKYFRRITPGNKWFPFLTVHYDATYETEAISKIILTESKARFSQISNGNFVSQSIIEIASCKNEILVSRRHYTCLDVFAYFPTTVFGWDLLPFQKRASYRSMNISCGIADA